MTDDEIARFQATLLEALSESDDPATVLARLEPGPLRHWVAGADPRMLAVAAHLVRAWSVRATDGSPRPGGDPPSG